MAQFKINKNLKVICEWKKTRMAFKHTAELLRNGQTIDETKICYQNRTWERYQFESVLYQMAGSKELTTREQNLFKKKIKNQFAEDNQKEIDKKFGTIGAIAGLGNILTQSKTQANNWKKRMLTAGLNLSMPSDWDELSEIEQEKRLDKVIELATKKL